MGRDCASELGPIVLAEGPTREPPAESPALTAAFGQKTAATGSAGVPTYLEGPESSPRPQARILRASAPWRLECGDIDPLPAARRPAVALVCHSVACRPRRGYYVPSSRRGHRVAGRLCYRRFCPGK